jgi:uncharacterized protein YbjT (DUF2867 family)
MRILLTGATGYIGKRLLPVLLDQGHHVICCVRDRRRFPAEDYPAGQVSVIEIDFTDSQSLAAIPQDIDGAYYLIHSMSSSIRNFEQAEVLSATNFRDCMNRTRVIHVIYLSGIANDQDLSPHLASRKKVEEVLSGGTYHFTTLRAGIIIGSGSASFEIIRDMVEKLPVMIAPKWLLTRSQPIAIRNVVSYLSKSLCNNVMFDIKVDIYGPDIMTYKDMLMEYARIRNLKRKIIVLPIMTPRLSSYWLYFVTSTSFPLAANLVDSMKVEVIGKPNRLAHLLEIELLSFSDAVKAAFQRIDQNAIISSWKDSLVSGRITSRVTGYIQVPVEGCYKDVRAQKIEDEQAVWERIWSIGGDQGWYYANWVWNLRGFVDKVFGGVGSSRGRTSPVKIHTGDTLDFWRVLLAEPDKRRLLLFAEMRLPGDAWLEFRIRDHTLYQEATFRPRGIFGRLYWFAMLPWHFFIFRGMLRKIGAPPAGIAK